MSYIGASPTTAAFPFDQFSGNGTTTAFTMSYAPASTTSMVVSISGVVQNPNTYSVSGLTLTFSGAPPTGTNNIGVLFLGLPASGVSTPGNTAYLTTTSFTATAGQTTFTPSGTYQVGFLNVIRNGSQLAPADYTATNGTTVVLNNACVAGDIVVIQVYTLTSLTNALPSTGGTVTGATTFNSTVSINGANGSGYTGYKNRVINGACVIDQRNNGSVITLTANTQGYPVDRMRLVNQTDGTLTAQRSTTAPDGFINSTLITVTATDTSIGTTQYAQYEQRIEGFNVADLGWGTAAAQTVTISFQVRSSLTGTYCLALYNSTGARCYVATYTINAANTWETKTITVAGDTSGTWQTGNTTGIDLIFTLTAGSSYQQTAGVWGTTAFAISTSAQTNFLGTNGATFYVTGVQLERGSNATSFEFRDYGRELIMCQRYYYRKTKEGGNASFGMGYIYTTSSWRGTVALPVTMRTTPTFTSDTVTNFGVQSAFGNITLSALSAIGQSTNEVWLDSTLVGATVGYSAALINVAGTPWIAVSAEL